MLTRPQSIPSGNKKDIRRFPHVSLSPTRKRKTPEVKQRTVAQTVPKPVSRAPELAGYAFAQAIQSLPRAEIVEYLRKDSCVPENVLSSIVSEIQTTAQEFQDIHLDIVSDAAYYVLRRLAEPSFFEKFSRDFCNISQSDLLRKITHTPVDREWPHWSYMHEEEDFAKLSPQYKRYLKEYQADRVAAAIKTSE